MRPCGGVAAREQPYFAPTYGDESILLQPCEAAAYRLDDEAKIARYILARHRQLDGTFAAALGSETFGEALQTQ